VLKLVVEDMGPHGLSLGIFSFALNKSKNYNKEYGMTEGDEVSMKLQVSMI